MVYTTLNLFLSSNSAADKGETLQGSCRIEPHQPATSGDPTLLLPLRIYPRDLFRKGKEDGGYSFEQQVTQVEHVTLLFDLLPLEKFSVRQAPRICNLPSKS